MNAASTFTMLDRHSASAQPFINSDWSCQRLTDFLMGAIVKLLLDKGADVNGQGEYYGNALQAAARYGNKTIVSLLLDKGANVNAQGGCSGNALQAAARYGHKTVVKLLLDKGADVNAEGGKYGNALSAATQCGQDAIVQLLLNHGAIDPDVLGETL